MKIKLYRISIAILIIILWQALASFNIINSFLFSSPKDILVCLTHLLKNGILFSNTITTLLEVTISSFISFGISFVLASFFINHNFIYNVFEPFLTVLNALPKVALGPLIIIIFGANFSSIIVMSILIGVFVTTINIYNYFKNTDYKYILLIKSFNGSKFDVFNYAIMGSNKENLIDAFNVNVSMTFIGTIMGELLVSKKGLGYLINYGTSNFNITLVITSIFILCILSYLIYIVLEFCHKKIIKR